MGWHLYKNATSYHLWVSEKFDYGMVTIHFIALGRACPGLVLKCTKHSRLERECWYAETEREYSILLWINIWRHMKCHFKCCLISIKIFEMDEIYRVEGQSWQLKICGILLVNCSISWIICYVSVRVHLSRKSDHVSSMTLCTVFWKSFTVFNAYSIQFE